MSERAIQEFIKIEPGSDDAHVAFLIEKIVGSRMQIEGSTDKMLIHSAWANNGWILAATERYGIDEPEPQLQEPEPPTDYQAFFKG